MLFAGIISHKQTRVSVVTEKEKEDKFKFQVVYLLPVFASLLFGLACAYVLIPQSSTAVPVAPLNNNTPTGPFGNALYFVVLVAVAATVFYFLLKRKSIKIIKALIVVAMTTASLLLSVVYLSTLFDYFPNWSILVIPLSIAITVLFDLAIFRLGSIPRNVAVICVGGALGVFFGKFIPLYSAVLILAFLAVYDVIAVYRGPVGKIAQSEGLEQLQGLSFSFKDIQMGLGDLVFYSMLTGVVFFSFLPNILPTIVSILGIMAGSIITLFILEKRGIFPGLPFPIMLGLAGGLITGLVIPLL
jgi:presenilin-like A22 family membrane protease